MRAIGAVGIPSAAKAAFLRLLFGVAEATPFQSKDSNYEACSMYGRRIVEAVVDGFGDCAVADLAVDGVGCGVA